MSQRTKEDALATGDKPVHQNQAPGRVRVMPLNALNDGAVVGVRKGEMTVVLARRTGKSILQKGPLSEEEKARMIELQQARDCTVCENATPEAWGAANRVDARELEALELRHAIFKRMKFQRR